MQLISIEKQELIDRIPEKFERFELISSKLKLNTLTGPWLCGGSVRRLFDKTEGDFDYDLFFKDAKVYESWLNQNKELVLNFSTNFADSYTLNLPKKDKVKVQAIRLYSETLKDVLDKFDFTCCQFGYDGKLIYTYPGSLIDALNRKIVINTVTFATVSILHMQKYIRQGYSICAGGATIFLKKVAENPTLIREDVKYID